MFPQGKKVAIIGAGLIGSATARELSKYDLDLVLVEKEQEVTFGVSKASSCIIHPGFRYWKPGTLRAEAVRKGHNLLRQLSKELSVEYKELGEIVVACNEKELEKLRTLKRQGETNGIDNLRFLSKEELREMEPNVTEEGIAALYAPTAGVSSSFELTIALVESALINGIKLLTETEVLNINKEKNGFILNTNKEDIYVDYIINAGGLSVNKIANMVGDELPIDGARGEEYIIDKNSGSLVNHLVFPAKGSFIIPTIHGNLMIGTTNEIINDYEDNVITAQGFDKIFSSAKKLIPKLERDQLIRGFAGVRPNPACGDVVISDKVPGFISACSGSPGIQTSLVIAEWIAEKLQRQGLELNKKDKFDPNREPIPCFNKLSIEERSKLIEKDPRYGHIICRCETVTEGEIVEAVKRGARTIDGVKYRTRAGMGRCQSGFCGPRVAAIIARELNIPREQIMKNINDSYYVKHKSKEFLLEDGGVNK